MDSIRIERYTPTRKREWDEFVGRSRNGTFLFLRDYMDYHSDRFRDSSRMAYVNGRLRALLPANVDEAGVLHSHQGLTYGGWVTPLGHLDGADLLRIFEHSLDEWRREGIKELDYKPVPHIYCKTPADEDRYALFRLGARLAGCGLSTSIDLLAGGQLNQMQRRHLKKALQLPVEITEERNATPFMGLLADCLMSRHGVTPVHSPEEMRMLKERFPDNIRIFVLRIAGDERPQAGVCVYDTGIVAHAQYIAATPFGRQENLLTPLFSHLIKYVYAARRYFDFGISTEDNGAYLNEGLLRQKSSYGGSGTVYERYGLKV